MTADESFDSAEYLAAWAGDELHRCSQIFADFATETPTKLVEEFNPKSGKHEVKFILKPLPFRMRGMASNIIKNMRDALDQVTHAAAMHICCTPRRNAHFPFGMSPKDFETALRLGPCKDIPEQLYPILRSYQPYPTSTDYTGGDDHLRLLGRISGSHKHRTTLILTTDPGLMTLSAHLVSGPVDIFPYLQDRPNMNEIVALSIGEGGYADCTLDAKFYVAFAETSLRQIPAAVFLKSSHEKVTHIVRNLRAETLKILKSSAL